METLIVAISLVVIFVMGYLIIKQYQTHTVLFIAGIILLCVAVMMGKTGFLPKTVKPTGFVGFDIFLSITGLIKKNIGGLGLIIMAAGGFSRYMAHIGAADAMVKLAIKPLSSIKNPYLILAASYLVGQFVNIFIPSASGLAMLLLITIYPLLIYSGVSKVSAAAVIGTTGALDLGPASGVTNFTAEILKSDVSLYFVKHQLPLGVVAAIVIAVSHYFVQQHYDKKEANNKKEATAEETANVKTELKDRPAIYALLPIIPLFLLIVFSKLMISSIKIDVVTAIFISLFISLAFECFRLRSLKEALAGVKEFYTGFGNILASVVMLIFAAQTFTLGLKAIGFIDILIHSMTSGGVYPIAVLLLFITMMSLTSFISGSAHSAFFAFAPLVPDMATKFGIPAVKMLLPMQFTGGLVRSFSPVSGVIIAVAAAIEVSPFEILKRNIIPMVLALIVSIFTEWFIFA